MQMQPLESVAPAHNKALPARGSLVVRLERRRLLTPRPIAPARPERAITGVGAAPPACERTLASPAVAEPRGHRLAEAIGLDADELGLLWFAVAFAADP